MPAKKTTKTKSTKSRSKSKTETIKTTGKNLLQKVMELIKQGNIRRISVIDKNGKTLIVIPLTIGVIGIALAPALAVVGGIAAFVTECTIKVEKK